tara:strand:- start:59 stop:454 length:396 start_codon:yes stop_codon:yes gene_type:complete
MLAEAKTDKLASDGHRKSAPQDTIRRMDSDGDGLLSFDEFKLPKRGNWMMRLKSSDSDGDGNISRVELEIELRRRFERENQKYQRRFERADLNGDGFITPEERKTGAFQRLDANDDGYISAREIDVGRSHH